MLPIPQIILLEQNYTHHVLDVHHVRSLQQFLPFYTSRTLCCSFVFVIQRWHSDHQVFEIIGQEAVIGKELGSIHNSTLQFRFFGIDFWNAPIPTPRVELGGQLQLQFHGIGGIPRDSTCLNFPLSIQVSLAVQKKPLVTPGSHLFSTFSTDFKTNIGIPWNPPNSVELELELWHQFQDWNLNWGSIPIPKFANGIGIGIDGIVPMTGVM